MSIEGIVFALLLFVGVVLMIALPLFNRQTEAVDPLMDKQRERLQLYYERVLRNLRDLDEDHALGKIEEAAYQVERELLVERGVQVLKALDSLPDRSQTMIAPTPAEDAAVDRAIDAAIEAAIKQYKDTNPNKDRVTE